ncbi:MAG: ribonuclease III [Planctomycetes bacterium]|nr:ribonuclease III [Planctomycetota bacterium]MBT4029291.1 ribonuclease III [Planctomycetota bacterium]MBT4561276.1 ribonuclease III [Planctomycetota bacterium]MBT7317916.1 ribonuclease III [Planctomycetota bacterium]
MTHANADFDELQDVLGYRFTDLTLLEEAVTHASLAEDHNERLEFLGDAVLNQIVAEELYLRHPNAREGELTEWKSRVISRVTLAEAGKRLGYANWLRVGPSLSNRAALPNSVIGNAFESLLGAVYLDAHATQSNGEASKSNAAKNAVLRWLGVEIDSAHIICQRSTAKQILQTLAQAKWGALPEYAVVETNEHPQSVAFLVEATVAGRTFPAAWGSPKKEAERWAAWEALLELNQDEGKCL